jgi:hypothetical protein
MPKKRAREHDLLVPAPTDIPRHDLIDTHLHLVSTFATFQQHFKDSGIATVQDFARKL